MYERIFRDFFEKSYSEGWVVKNEGQWGGRVKVEVSIYKTSGEEVDIVGYGSRYHEWGRKQCQVYILIRVYNPAYYVQISGIGAVSCQREARTTSPQPRSLPR